MLAILNALLKSREAGQPLVSVEALARHTHTTEGTLRGVLNELEDAGLVADSDVSGQTHYLAAFDKEQTDFVLVIERLLRTGQTDLALFTHLDPLLQELKDTLQKSPANRSIADL
jgi:DNA-binding IclR family transcriptional regulator